MIINEKGIALGIHLCISNAERFLFSAKILAENNRRQDACLLSLYALEEMGKVPLVANLPFYFDQRETLSAWKKRFRDHEEKFHFSKDIDDFTLGRLPEEGNKIDRKKGKEKQDISYVNFQGNVLVPPADVDDKDLKELMKVASQRLSFLEQNHPSVESDELRLIETIPKLKGLTSDQLKETWEKLKGE